MHERIVLLLLACFSVFACGLYAQTPDTSKHPPLAPENSILFKGKVLKVSDLPNDPGHLHMSAHATKIVVDSPQTNPCCAELVKKVIAADNTAAALHFTVRVFVDAQPEHSLDRTVTQYGCEDRSDSCDIHITDLYINSLNEDELTAVLGHEIGHIGQLPKTPENALAREFSDDTHTILLLRKLNVVDPEGVLESALMKMLVDAPNLDKAMRTAIAKRINHLHSLPAQHHAAQRTLKQGFFSFDVSLAGIEPAPPPSEGGILSIELQGRFMLRRAARRLVYYKRREFVNGGDGKYGDGEIEEKLLEAR